MKKNKLREGGFRFTFDEEEVEKIFTDHIIEKENEPIPKEEVDVNWWVDLDEEEIQVEVTPKKR